MRDSTVTNVSFHTSAEVFHRPFLHYKEVIKLDECPNEFELVL